MDRLQVLVSPEEKEAFRRMAKKEGLSLSAWLREAGLRRLAEAEKGARIDSVEKLREFFGRCDRQEPGDEPDWEAHRQVIRGSVGKGSSGT